MIIKLSLETINSRSPYFVDMVSDNGPFAFTSDSGVELAVDFVDDDLITTTESYKLVVSNVNNRQSPRDKKVQETVFDMFEYSKKYTSLSTSLTDEDGIMNAATVFIRNDNPQLPKIVNEFNETAMLLRQKPN